MIVVNLIARFLDLKSLLCKNKNMRKTFAVIFAITFILSCYDSYCQGNAITTVKTDKGETFNYQILKEEQNNDYRVLYLSFPSPVKSQLAENNTVSARYFVPNNINNSKRPAVISLPILNGDENLSSMVCALLAKRGIPSIMFTLPYYAERGNREIRKKMEQEPHLYLQAIEQAFAEIGRVADLLASRPEVDKEKISLTGISLGGVLSASAAGMDNRFYKVGILLGGGDLWTIINNAKETRNLSLALKNLPEQEREVLKNKLLAIDPLTHASKIRDPKNRVLMINAAQDEVIPCQCTEKLAEALGIKDKVIWFEGLGHYTAIAELPRALNILADFFAADLPPEVSKQKSTQREPTAMDIVVEITRDLLSTCITAPDEGRCNFLKFDLNGTNKNNSPINVSLQLIVGDKGRFSALFKYPLIGEGGVGFGSNPWMLTPKTLFIGNKQPLDNTNSFAYFDSHYTMRAQGFAGAVMAILLVPDFAKKWVKVDFEDEQKNRIIVKSGESSRVAGFIRIGLLKNSKSPEFFEFDLAGVRGKINVYGWQKNSFIPATSFEPPEATDKKEVCQSDLNKMVAAAMNFIGEMLDEKSSRELKKEQVLKVVEKDPSGHGLLCDFGGKTILILDGTPQEMGTAQGNLMDDSTKKLVERVLYAVGAADTFRSGKWFIDVMEDIYTKTSPHIPPRFIEECNSLAKSAKIPQRDLLYANLFPERFHCSGIAVKGKATVDGKILHSRVLDYMRDIGLQNYAAVVVFMPEGKNAWMTLGYSGFIGTVTAMNEKGVAIGEMGGRGEGLWNGVPMSLLLRDVMERASTGEEALQIIHNSPRTCEYYYVISDKNGFIRGLHCLPDKVEVLKPGEQHPLLPPVPEDTVFISGGERAKILSQRLSENYGKIDVDKMIEIIKRPVAMKSNLHNAIFAPQTVEMWFADAGKKTPACDEPYTRVSLSELIDFYKRTKLAANN